MPQEVDINLMLARASIAIDPEETTDERVARLKRESREHVFEMVKGFIVFVVVVAALLSIGGVCAYKGLFDSAASVETQRWAQTTLSALFAGSVSFVLGQMTVKKAR
jgi:hypothetical protein